MSEPDQNRLCRLLYAYELGLLEGDQRDQFELHLMDCPDCRRQAEEFLTATHLLKHDPEIRGLVEGLQSPEDQSKRRKTWPAVLAIAAAVTLLVLQPWHLEFRSTQEATASENRLAILYVGNPAESADLAGLGQTVASLLIADLSESQFLRVISSQRLFDAGQRLGVPDPTRIDQSHAGAVAHEVGANWMLTANLVTDGTQQRLITQLFDVATGVIEATQAVVIDSSASIFSQVDQLSVQLKTDLGLPDQALKEADPNVADVTTHSVEAYRFYLKGVELNQRMYAGDAAAHFYKAIRLDSSFAMAYYYLSISSNTALIDKAVACSSHATKKEQMFIAARAAQVKGDTVQALAILQSITEQYPDEKEAFLQLGLYYYERLDFRRSIFYLEKAIALDPLFRRALNQLAYSYDSNGQLDEALQTLDEYQKIAPKEPNPLDSRGDILGSHGRLSEAIAAYARAVEIDPNFVASQPKLYYAYLADGQYNQAEKIYKQWEAGCAEGNCAYIYWTKANTLTLRGQYREALPWLDKAMEADRVSATKSGFSIADGLYISKAQVLIALDSSAVADADMAIKCLRKTRPDDKITHRNTLARALAQAGQLDSAVKVVEQLRRDVESARMPMFTYWMAEGYLELARGNALTAAESFDKAATSRPSRTEYLPRFLQGQALVLAGQPSKAVEILAAQERCYSEARTRECFTSSRLYYYLGRAYEESGHPDSATAKYEKFLGIWENADPDLKEYTDARARLAHLKTTP